MTSTSSAERNTRVRAIAEQRSHDRGALLPILHEVMAEFGHIDRVDIETIADVLNFSVADVHGVVSFYHDFRDRPASQRVQVCRGEACQAVGAERVWEELPSHLTRGDVSVEQVFCLGNCALGPSAMVNGRLIGQTDASGLAAEVAR